jgi:Protein of unknown function (DUF3150)
MNQSITKRAMLVSLNIQQWTGAKHDRKVSQEVAIAHNSDVSMGRYRKLLVAKESLERLRQLTSTARQEHYKRTLPWSDGGTRILSSEAYFEYAEKMRELGREWEPAVDEFLAQYPQVIAEARGRLNGLFNEEDYPTPANMRRKFSFTFSVLPMPTAKDFRVELGDAETKRVRAEIEESVNESLRVAMNDVWERLRDVVSRMVERLRAYSMTEKGVSNPFRDSLVTNIRELLDVLPSLNITQDANLTEVAQKIGAELCRYDADTLREDTSARERTADAAEAILKQMEAFI